MKQLYREVEDVSAHFRSAVDWNWRRFGGLQYQAQPLRSDVTRAVNWGVLTPIVQGTYQKLWTRNS